MQTRMMRHEFDLAAIRVRGKTAKLGDAEYAGGRAREDVRFSVVADITLPQGTPSNEKHVSSGPWQRIPHHPMFLLSTPQ